MEEPKKPPFERRFTMEHVPPPNPENYWWLDLNDPRVVMVDQDTFEPKLTIVVREIKDNRVALQLVAPASLPRHGSQTSL